MRAGLLSLKAKEIVLIGSRTIPMADLLTKIRQRIRARIKTLGWSTEKSSGSPGVPAAAQGKTPLAAKVTAYCLPQLHLFPTVTDWESLEKLL